MIHVGQDDILSDDSLTHTSRKEANARLNPAKVFHRRHLPHYHPPNATIFVTFRLAGSLPRSRVLELREERRVLAERTEKGQGRLMRNRSSSGEYVRDLQWLDRVLEKAGNNPHWLSNPRVADMVVEAIRYRDSKEYDVVAYCVMPNHVHLVFAVGKHGLFESVGQIANLSDKPVSKIMHSLKRYTAREANKILKRHGPFWQDESYDHVIRDSEELERTVEYVLRNPVEAGLVGSWRDWRWVYSRFET